MKITLDLDAYGMDHREFVEWIRGGLGGKFEKVATDIEAQLPKPTPPEPKGYYLLQEPDGRVSVPVGGGVLNRLDNGARLYWDTLWACHGSDMKIYRAELWPEAVEALVQDLAQQIMNGGPWVSQVAIANNVRGFVRRLLGGDQ